MRPAAGTSVPTRRASSADSPSATAAAVSSAHTTPSPVSLAATSTLSQPRLALVAAATRNVIDITHLWTLLSACLQESTVPAVKLVLVMGTRLKICWRL